jgi:hypothetical protein
MQKIRRNKKNPILNRRRNTGSIALPVSFIIELADGMIIQKEVILLMNVLGKAVGFVEVVDDKF